MNRRGMIRAAFASIGAGVAAGEARAQASDKATVVYHLCDLDKVAFVIGNIQNHFDGMGGPDKVTIELVIHGPALKAFHGVSASPEVAARIRNFRKAGLSLAACGNTMKAQKVALKDLLPGFAVAEQGGVVRLAQLQQRGYAYIRP